MVNQILGHFASLNVHGPSKQHRHTGTSNEFQTCQPISSRNIDTPCAKHPGTSKDNLTLQGDIKSDGRLPNSQCDALSQPGTFLDSLSPKYLSWHGMTPSSLTSSVSSLKPCSGSLTSSALGPSTSSPDSLTPSETESYNSADSLTTR